MTPLEAATVEASAPFDPSQQVTIEMPNGVSLTGIGGDVEAITEAADERHEARTGKAVERAEPKEATAPTRGQKRFSELTREREDAVRRAEVAEAEAKSLRARIDTPKIEPTKDTAKPSAETRPKPNESDIGTKYQSLSDYFEDLSDWKSEQREVKLRADFDARLKDSIEADRASRTRSSVVNDAFTRGRTAYPDFDAMLDSVNTIQIPPSHQEAILSLPNFEHVMYALAKDPAKLTKILTIQNPVILGVELAQLIPRAEAVAPTLASTPAAVRTTNAPAPPQPVGAGTRTAKPTLQELADRGDTEAYKAARDAGQTY